MFTNKLIGPQFQYFLASNYTSFGPQFNFLGLKYATRLNRNDEKRSRNPPNVLTCLFLAVDGIFMEKTRMSFFFDFLSITSTVHREVEKLTKFFQSFISPAPGLSNIG